jgi:hypothetical protein
MSSRLLALRRTLIICAALFAVLLTFLSLQMLRGRDPSLQSAQAPAARPEVQRADDGSLLTSIVGFAASVITEGDDDGEHDGGGSAVRTQAS